MHKNVTQKLIESHLVEGEMKAGAEIGLKIDQTLTQDATGTMVMLEFEALQMPCVKTDLSAQYVDHNLLQTDFKNPDDHLITKGETYETEHSLSERQVKMILAGSLINLVRKEM